MFQNQEIYCENCQDKLEDSYQCSNCQSQFCETCIIQQQIILKSCLICQSFDSQYIKSYNQSNLDSNKIIPCIYKDEGCKQQIAEKNINQHIQACKFALILCKYCGEQFIKETIQKHKQECLKVCLKCESQFKYRSLHDCSESLKIRLQQQEQIYQNRINQLVKLNEANLRKRQLYEDQLSSQVEKQPQKQIESELLKRDVLVCVNGHYLKWEKKNIGKNCCEICKSLQLPLRFTCGRCHFFYCQKCKFQVFTGTVCPRKHTLELLKYAQQGKQCDVCDEKIQQRKKYYFDNICDYVICNKCFKEVNKFQSK